MRQPSELEYRYVLPYTAPTHHGEFTELHILDATLCSCSHDFTLFLILLKPAFYLHASSHLALPISPWGNNGSAVSEEGSGVTLL